MQKEIFGGSFHGPNYNTRFKNEKSSTGWPAELGLVRLIPKWRRCQVQDNEETESCVQYPTHLAPLALSYADQINCQLNFKLYNTTIFYDTLILQPQVSK